MNCHEKLLFSENFKCFTVGNSRLKGRYMQFSIRNILIILLFTPFLYGQFTTDPGAGKPTVAILDFEGRGVSPQEVQTLSDRMRTEIGNTNAVRLIERKAVEKIMEEQGFQQSGCTTDECASEVGQLLGVQSINWSGAPSVGAWHAASRCWTPPGPERCLPGARTLGSTGNR